MKNVTLLISFLILHSFSNLSAQSVDSLIQLGKNKCYEQPDSALLLFDMALEIQPKSKEAISAKLNCLLSTDQANKALSFATALIASDTTNAEYYFMRGTIKNNQSYPDSSCLLDYYKAIQINPNYFDALYNIGVFYFNMAAEINEKLKLPSDNSETLIENRKY